MMEASKTTERRDVSYDAALIWKENSSRTRKNGIVVVDLGQCEKLIP